MTDPVKLQEYRDADLVSAYVIIRDKRAAAKAEFDKRDTLLAVQLERIESDLLRRYEEQGTTQIKVAGIGTASRTTKTLVTCADWSVFYAWLFKEAKRKEAAGQDPLETYSFFQKRLTQDTVSGYMELHEGNVPPAVNVAKQYAISVRRSTK